MIKQMLIFTCAIALFSCGEAPTEKGNEVNSTVVQKESADSLDLKKDGNGMSDLKELSLKKRTLTNLTGEYKLNSIVGATGANTMLDYFVEKGRWTASGSSINDGMREAYDIELSKNDRLKLQTMKIVVGEDLSVALHCNNIAYFNAPFQEEGMTYILRNSPKEYSSYMSESLKKTTTFLEDYLYLYAKDQINESEIRNVDIAEIGADALVIKYNTKTKEFEVVLFYGDCCDNVIYTFK